MSDTEVDEPPEDVVQTFETTIESADVRRGGGARRSALVVVPLVLGLLVVAGVGARMLWADIPARTQAEGPGKVLCWDGTTRPESKCGAPAGRAGLRWMFPSFKPADLGCRDVLAEFPRSQRPAMFQCGGNVPAGSATIIYSQLVSVESGRHYLQQVFGSPPQSLDDHLGRRLLWTEGDEPGRDDVYDLAVMYAELPFGVEVSARSARTRDEALERLVRFRPEAHATIRPGDPVS